MKDRWPFRSLNIERPFSWGDAMSDHTWNAIYAKSLLDEAGYKTRFVHKAFRFTGTAELHINDWKHGTDHEIAIVDGRIRSSDIQPFLDAPLMMGSMRVR